tara:strand:- start:33 stop:182 length:150 start_codon:yes stop_codon:yes gene_type:complete
MTIFKDKHKCRVGLSDHSNDNKVINKKAPKKLFNGEPILPNILKKLRIK